MLLRVAFPAWFVVFWSICAAPFAGATLLMWIDFGRATPTTSGFVACVVLSVVNVLLLSVGVIVHSAIVATESGIEVEGVFRTSTILPSTIRILRQVGLSRVLPLRVPWPRKRATA